MLEILADHHLAPNQVVAARYRLDRIVGEGGMGVVWAATHVLTEKPCALKFIKAARAADPKSHERLLHEARAACKVRHPNVAQVHDILELASGVPFIVMDLLEGEPLSARLARRGRFELREAATLLLQIVDAVTAAHALGIVHRDLKPDNVFLERGHQGRDVVKILDFGIAKHVDVVGEPAPAPLLVGASAGLTTTHSMIGTPLYMAPEQIRRERNVDARVDVWSVGVIAFECLLGERPERDAETSGIAAAAFARFDAREPPIPGDVRALLSRLLATDIDARGTLEEARQVLHGYTGEAIDAPSFSATATLTSVNAPAVRASTPTRIASIGTLLGAAALVGAFAFARDRYAPASPAAPPPVTTVVTPASDPAGPAAVAPPAPPSVSAVVTQAVPATRAVIARPRPKARTPQVAPPPSASSAPSAAPVHEGIPAYERE